MITLSTTTYSSEEEQQLTPRIGPLTSEEDAELCLLQSMRLLALANTDNLSLDQYYLIYTTNKINRQFLCNNPIAKSIFNQIFNQNISSIQQKIKIKKMHVFNLITYFYQNLRFMFPIIQIIHIGSTCYQTSLPISSIDILITINQFQSLDICANIIQAIRNLSTFTDCKYSSEPVPHYILEYDDLSSKNKKSRKMFIYFEHYSQQGYKTQSHDLYIQQYFQKYPLLKQVLIALKHLVKKTKTYGRITDGFANFDLFMMVLAFNQENRDAIKNVKTSSQLFMRLMVFYQHIYKDKNWITIKYSSQEKQCLMAQHRKLLQNKLKIIEIFDPLDSKKNDIKSYEIKRNYQLVNIFREIIKIQCFFVQNIRKAENLTETNEEFEDAVTKTVLESGLFKKMRDYFKYN